MAEPRLNYVQCLGAAGLHKMAYWEWAPADPRAPVLVCVHGLSRQGLLKILVRLRLDPRADGEGSIDGRGE